MGNQANILQLENNTEQPKSFDYLASDLMNELAQSSGQRIILSDRLSDGEETVLTFRVVKNEMKSDPLLIELLESAEHFGFSPKLYGQNIKLKDQNFKVTGFNNGKKINNVCFRLESSSEIRFISLSSMRVLAPQFFSNEKKVSWWKALFKR